MDAEGQPKASCAYTRCKTHCIIDKQGCTATGHQPERLTSRQRDKLLQPPRQDTPRTRFPTLSPNSLSIIHDAIAPFTLPPIHQRLDPIEQGLIQDAEREEAEDLAQDEVFVAQDEEFRRLMLPEFSFTPEQLAEEEAKISLAIRLSKETAAAVATSGSSSSTSTSSTSTVGSSSRLRPVYPAGKAPPTTIAGADKSGSTRPPKMTTQMSAPWMRDYKDNTAAEAARTKYKTSLDLTAGRKITLVCWGSVSIHSSSTP